MSKITLAPNAAGTGTLTVAAPNTNTDYTLTLPTATTTLVGTDATQTLTNKSIAGSQLTGTVASSLLTGALPAIDGSALTGIVTGGMTLLGTLTTTSGSTVTLSGLTLTSYQQIVAVIKNVSQNASAPITFSGINITAAPINTNVSTFGIFTVDLTTGVWVCPATVSLSIGETNSNGATTGWFAGIQNTLTTSSTSISFSVAATFDAGSIRIYGVK